MKCKRLGCPNLVNGQYAWASVYDEVKAKKNAAYTKPHLEQWCLECYQNLEAHKYTYVMLMPDVQRKRYAKRVKRIGQPGEVIQDAPVNLAQTAPISNATPPWLDEPVEKAPPPQLEDIERDPTIVKKVRQKSKRPRKVIVESSASDV